MVDTVLFDAALAESPAPTPLTTGASPVAADTDVAAYAITTGGTAGVEVIDLPLHTLDLGGISNARKIGKRVFFYLATKTHASDSVKITTDGDGRTYVFPGAIYRNSDAQRTTTAGVVLDYVGAMACFIWCGDAWLYDHALSDGLNSTEFLARVVQILMPDTLTGSPQGITISASDGGAGDIGGGNIQLLAGGGVGAGYGGGVTLLAGTAGGSVDGGNVALSSGDALGAGNGGNIVITLGTGSANGKFIFLNLPTANPSVAGAVWNDSGTLKISAG